MADFSSHLSRSFATGDLASVRQVVSEHPAVLRLNRQRQHDLILAIDEIMSNAIRHGGGKGQLELAFSDGQVWFRVTDHGPGMSTEPPAAAPAPNQLGGRGIWIVRQIVDRLARSRPAPTGRS